MQSALTNPKFSPNFVRTVEPTSLVSPFVQTSGIVFKTIAGKASKSDPVKSNGDIGAEGGGSNRLREDTEHESPIGGEGGGTGR